jgi:hypothetical protein
MSRPDRARLSDHFSATSEAGREADQSHEVRHCAGRGHRLKVQRLQAGRVTPCTQPSGSAEGAQAAQGWFALRKLRPTTSKPRVLNSN